MTFRNVDINLFGAHLAERQKLLENLRNLEEANPDFVEVCPHGLGHWPWKRSWVRWVDGCNILGRYWAADRPTSPRLTQPYERTHREVAPRPTAYTSR
jgi:hypothetical protein